jgi:REDY-like protein HapK
MPTLIVLFNLKNKETAAADYEKWAQTTDVPTVKGLKSVADFKVYRMGNILGTETPAPYQYCEVIEINDMNGLFADIGTETMQRVAAEFQVFADNPMFMSAEQCA